MICPTPQRASAHLRPHTCLAHAMCTWTGTSPRPRAAAMGATPCPAVTSGPGVSANGASRRPQRWFATTTKAVSTPPARGGCCSGWATATQLSWTADVRPGKPWARPGSPHQRPSTPSHPIRPSHRACRPSRPTHCWSAWVNSPSWTRGPPNASEAKSSPWTRSPATFLAPSVISSRTTWLRTAASSPRLNCASPWLRGRARVKWSTSADRA